MPLEIKLIHEAIAGARDVIVLGVVLESKRDKQMPVENLHVEGREARRQPGIGEAVHLLELLVEHVHCSVPKVRREQERAIVSFSDGESLINGPGAVVGVVDRNHRTAAVDEGIPAGNCAVLSGEDEDRGRLRCAVGNIEASSGNIEHLPGWGGCTLARGWRDGDCRVAVDRYWGPGAGVDGDDAWRVGRRT